MTRRILLWTVAAVITGLYVYMVVAAVGNLLLLPDMAASLSLSLTGAGWWWLGFGVALPILAYLLALVAARGRTFGTRLWCLGAGLCAAAAVQLEVLHLVPQSSFFG